MWIYWHGRLAGGFPIHCICACMRFAEFLYIAMQRWVLQSGSWHIAINCHLVQETVWSLAWNYLFIKKLVHEIREVYAFSNESCLLLSPRHCDVTLTTWQSGDLSITCPLRTTSIYLPSRSNFTNRCHFVLLICLAYYFQLKNVCHECDCMIWVQLVGYFGLQLYPNNHWLILSYVSQFFYFVVFPLIFYSWLQLTVRTTRGFCNFLKLKFILLSQYYKGGALLLSTCNDYWKPVIMWA